MNEKKNLIYLIFLFQKGCLINDLDKIFMANLKNGFFFDLLPTISLILLISNRNNP